MMESGEDYLVNLCEHFKDKKVNYMVLVAKNTPLC